MIWIKLYNNKRHSISGPQGRAIECLISIFRQQWSYYKSWWRHQMEKFSTLLVFCAGNSLVTGEFPAQRPVTWNFDVFFDLCLNKRLNKQSWGWWFEVPSRSLWRHCNVLCFLFLCQCIMSMDFLDTNYLTFRSLDAEFYLLLHV